MTLARTRNNGCGAPHGRPRRAPPPPPAWAVSLWVPPPAVGPQAGPPHPQPGAAPNTLADEPSTPPCQNIEGGEDIFSFAVSKISMTIRFIGANRTGGHASQPAQRTRDSRSRR